MGEAEGGWGALERERAGRLVPGRGRGGRFGPGWMGGALEGGWFVALCCLGEVVWVCRQIPSFFVGLAGDEEANRAGRVLGEDRGEICWPGRRGPFKECESGLWVEVGVPPERRARRWLEMEHFRSFRPGFGGMREAGILRGDRAVFSPERGGDLEFQAGPGWRVRSPARSVFDSQHHSPESSQRPTGRFTGGGD